MSRFGGGQQSRLWNRLVPKYKRGSYVPCLFIGGCLIFKGFVFSLPFIALRTALAGLF